MNRSSSSSFVGPAAGLTRRGMLKSIAALATIQIVPRHVIGQGRTPPSEMLTKGVIGCGGMSSGHLFNYPGKLLAICDVDQRHLDGRLNECKGRGWNDVTPYRDYRELLARADVDIVHIVTPPHWHGLMAIAAAKAGKDIWCEKPMTRTIGEGLKVIEAVARHQRMMRINTWFRFDDRYYSTMKPARDTRKAVAAGLFGWPLKFHIGNNVVGGGWKLRMWSGRTNLEPQPVPANLDYDRWLGPAPMKPYHPHRVHGSFRGYWDYDGGGLGDMGQHFLDPAQYILGKDETSPVAIEVDTDPQDPDAVLPWRKVVLRYADGCEIHCWGETKEPENLPVLEGPEGKLFPEWKSDITGFREKVAALPDPDRGITDFHQSVRERKRFALNELNGHRSTNLINLAKTALQLGRNLTFDPDKQVFTGADAEAANAYINQPMRPGFNYETAT
jgi:myo-inositol 2-dehydrogenase / D-chiro-inositol 1-dehydrogenase